MKDNLTDKKCKPCEGGVARLERREYLPLLKQLILPWQVIDDIKISHEFTFPGYEKVIEFVNRVAALAEEEGHHPVMHVYYSKVVVELWTFAILGLSENDFILAAKIEQIEKN
jgi:4a-hydroxytetrahydrobiopterin dehydratase